MILNNTELAIYLNSTHYGTPVVVIPSTVITNYLNSTLCMLQRASNT